MTESSPVLSLLLHCSHSQTLCVPWRWRSGGRTALPSPSGRVPGPQLTWGTRKARHLAPSRETPEVRDGTPSPAAPQFTMFVLSWLKELKQGADTLGPAHLCPDTFPEPPHPALLTHMHTQPHSIRLSHTPVSTQAHKTIPPIHTHTQYLHSFPHFFTVTHTFPRDHILLTLTRVLVHTHDPHTCPCTFTSIQALAWKRPLPFPVTGPP